jgi:adhesin transport system membrane fusion protein
MLNISSNTIRERFDGKKFVAMRKTENLKSGKVTVRLLVGFLIFALFTMFMPWTQNIRSKGTVTTLEPNQRPQTIHSVIAGRIETWFIREGDYVDKGDTILFISEVKPEYFDPNLVARTKEQLDSKEMSVNAYLEKVGALDNQIEALRETSSLKAQQAQNKLQQAKLKATSDSIDFYAASINHNISIVQLERMEKLYEEGLKSLTDLEKRRLNMQKAQASMISAENKLLTSQNEIINARVELTSVQVQYQDYIAKSEAEKYSALSNMYDAEAVVSKLQNQFVNYSIRNGMYYVTAPLNGYITKALQTGIGETLKEGEAIVSIMPAAYDLAVEMYIRPIDLPLLEKGQKIRLQFDGWPAIVFSGWPNTSFGTYGGEVFAIDNFISANGMYRVLVSSDPNDHPWPTALRVGAGTSNMVLLKDVPIWYEMWRQINGFPPDYYKPIPTTQAK